MRPEDLTPGVYQLKEDVINPDGDGRRKNYLISAGTWPKGAKVVVGELAHPRFAVEQAKKNGEELPPRFELRILPYAPYNNAARFGPGNDAYEYLVEALEPAPMDLQGLFAVHELSDYHYEEVLKELLRLKVVNLSGVRAAIQSLEESWNKEE